MLKKRIFCRVLHPSTVSEMYQAIKEELAEISDEQISAIVDTMPDWVQAVTAANGGPTCYQIVFLYLSVHLCVQIIVIHDILIPH